MRKALLFSLVLAILNFGLWAGLNRPATDIPEFQGRIGGVAWSPYPLRGGPGSTITPEQLRADLQAIARHASTVRTYSVLGGLDRIPALAADLPLTFMLGAWVGGNRTDAQERVRAEERSRLEVARVIELANSFSNVTHVLVGNEALLRNELTVETIAPYLQQVRAAIRQPVSVAEPAEVWLANPDLANHVDFIAIHVLPYWEREAQGRDPLLHSIERIREVQRRFPDKEVIVTEIGYPTDGRTREASAPSVVTQARFLRGFFNYAQRAGLRYFIMEAIDQPWKTTIEGSPGPYWGFLNGDRQPKYALTGPVWERPNWSTLALAASLIALPLMAFLGWRRRGLRSGPLIALLAVVQLLVAGAVYFWHITEQQYLFSLAWAPWIFSLVMLIGLAAVFMAEWFELMDVMGTRLSRVYNRAPFARDRRAPKVSIHLPIHNEPSAVVIETLESLAALDWPDFEVIVIDNNTKDERVWRPVETHCAALNARFPGRFLFFHVDPLKGFKAGALNFALQRTDPDAAYIGVVDADYIVDPQWLRRAIPAFDEPDVGFVQAPQDHRDVEDNAFKRMIGWEYAGFFHLGMVQRNERNALIQHGTMVLLRRAAMAPGWATWCIVEDAEMGLRLAAGGWRSVYIRETLGRGLMPDHFGAYKTQRFRWAYGAVQILRRYWRELLLPGRLNFAQRYHFIAGWASWFADAGGLIFAWGAILWTFAVLPVPYFFNLAVGELSRYFAVDLAPYFAWTGYVPRTSDYFVLPHAAFLIPVIAAFGLRMFQVLVLYRLRVACSFKETVMAAVAGLGLSYTVGRAILTGLVTKKKPFVRTPKADGRLALTQAFRVARGETILMLALWCAAGLTFWIWSGPSFEDELRRPFPWLMRLGYDPDAILWGVNMMIQSLPYAAALVTSLVSSIAGRKRKSLAKLPIVHPAAGD